MYSANNNCGDCREQKISEVCSGYYQLLYFFNPERNCRKRIRGGIITTGKGLSCPGNARCECGPWVLRAASLETAVQDWLARRAASASALCTQQLCKARTGSSERRCWCSSARDCRNLRKTLLQPALPALHGVGTDPSKAQGRKSCRLSLHRDELSANIYSSSG